MALHAMSRLRWSGPGSRDEVGFAVVHLDPEHRIRCMDQVMMVFLASGLKVKVAMLEAGRAVHHAAPLPAKILGMTLYARDENESGSRKKLVTEMRRSPNSASTSFTVLWR